MTRRPYDNGRGVDGGTWGRVMIRRMNALIRTTRSTPWRDIALALMLKFALLAMLYLAFFSPSHRAPADIAAHLFSPLGVVSPNARK